MYNGERTIQRAVESCLNQIYLNVEILVINNESTDSTLSLLNEFQDSRVKIFGTIKGRSRARNMGIAESTGKYILFLDADDALYKDRIDIGVKYLESNLDFFGHVCCVDYFDENNQSMLKVVRPNYSGHLDMLEQNPFPINSVLFTNNNKKYFEENLDYNEDWLFYANVLKEKKIYIDLGYTGAIVYVHENNTMSDLDKMIGYQLVVQSKVIQLLTNSQKCLYNKRSLKLLLLYNFLEKQESLHREIKHIYKGFYYLSYFICRVPFLSTILANRSKRFKKEYYYIQEENN